ncbi:MAG: T9SS type A sorting domain-containing protein [bacterium]
MIQLVLLVTFCYIKTDDSDNPHISYHDTTNTNLKYAYYSTCKVISSLNKDLRKFNGDLSINKLYPNTTSDLLNIDITINKEGYYELQIFDMQGRIIKIIPIYTTGICNKLISINTSGLNSGVYLIKIFDDKENIVRKFIINK